MTLLVETPDVVLTEADNHIAEIPVEETHDQLTIEMRTIHEDVSNMPAELIKERQAKSPRLKSLFNQTLDMHGDKGIECDWKDGETVDVKGLSKIDLHSFILKAESIGKKITYTRTYQVKISD